MSACVRAQLEVAEVGVMQESPPGGPVASSSEAAPVRASFPAGVEAMADAVAAEALSFSLSFSLCQLSFSFFAVCFSLPVSFSFRLCCLFLLFLFL